VPAGGRNKQHVHEKEPSVRGAPDGGEQGEDERVPTPPERARLTTKHFSSAAPSGVNTSAIASTSEYEAGWEALQSERRRRAGRNGCDRKTQSDIRRFSRTRKSWRAAGITEKSRLSARQCNMRSSCTAPPPRRRRHRRRRQGLGPVASPSRLVGLPSHDRGARGHAIGGPGSPDDVSGSADRPHRRDGVGDHLQNPTAAGVCLEGGGHERREGGPLGLAESAGAQRPLQQLLADARGALGQDWFSDA
jgi:hypothetical protein